MNCYILTGGASRRMGVPKTALFLDRVVSAARPVFDEVLAVHRSDGAPLPIRTLFETAHAGDGPLFGIQRALQDAGGRAFILAVDYPLITSDVLRFLSDRFVRSSAVVVIASWGGRRQNLCGGYDASLLPLIEDRIRRERYDVHSLIEESDAQVIEESDLRTRFSGEPLMNVNTPEDLQRAEAMHGT
jgi:molybdopterin-guanine dinucleotide biosynthesis protein A